MKFENFNIKNYAAVEKASELKITDGRLRTSNCFAVKREGSNPSCCTNKFLQIN